MRIAILGASSQIARDLAPRLLQQGHALARFARSPERLPALAGSSAEGFAAFPGGSFDAVLNCVGVGEPARTAALGAAILDVTRTYDDLALDYLRSHGACRYIFLSSGAAYGSTFEQPADDDTVATVPLNGLGPAHWYGLAKLVAEGRHRALADLAIVDLRVFGYVSHTQDLAGRFLVTDALRAIVEGRSLATSPEPIFRDFAHPADLHALVEAVLAAGPVNTVLDVYSRAPVDKASLLQALQERFGLQYEVVARPAAVNATGSKPHYYSRSRRAAAFGYEPRYSALEAVLAEAELALARVRRTS